MTKFEELFRQSVETPVSDLVELNKIITILENESGKFAVDGTWGHEIKPAIINHLINKVKDSIRHTELQ